MSGALLKTATYTLLDGTKKTIEYDPEWPCMVCGLPVWEASMGGTAVCPACDCGLYRDGCRWVVRLNAEGKFEPRFRDGHCYLHGPPTPVAFYGGMGKSW